MENLIKDIHRLGQKEKIIIYIILSVCFAIGFIGASYFGKQKSQLFQSNNALPSSTASPKQAELSLYTSNLQTKVGEPFDIQLNLSSSDIGVEAADFIIRYDSAYIQINDISLGNYFQNYPIKRITADYIKISAVASFIANKIIIPKGEGTIATIHATPAQSIEKTTIFIDHDKTVIASAGRNILGQTNSLTISIQ
ncbi:MAG: hypothetical protein EPN88_01405 [Bacteroidetes bacterium]|nr:MAG: hypothetical protein EPN88_01405 [Bacteroidota bacterium]